VLLWLRENGCPSNDAMIVINAARGGDIAMIQYVVEQFLMQDGIPDANVLALMLFVAGVHCQLAAAQWLRQQGAASLG
jgi:hypothetical protein